MRRPPLHGQEASFRGGFLFRDVGLFLIATQVDCFPFCSAFGSSEGNHFLLQRFSLVSFAQCLLLLRSDTLLLQADLFLWQRHYVWPVPCGNEFVVVRRSFAGLFLMKGWLRSTLRSQRWKPVSKECRRTSTSCMSTGISSESYGTHTTHYVRFYIPTR